MIKNLILHIEDITYEKCSYMFCFFDILKQELPDIVWYMYTWMYSYSSDHGSNKMILFAKVAEVLNGNNHQILAAFFFKI